MNYCRDTLIRFTKQLHSELHGLLKQTIIFVTCKQKP